MISIKNKIIQFANTLNLTEAGVCNTPDGKQAIVFLFPYKISSTGGRISMYARGEDYHLVTKKYLKKVCDFIFSETGLDFSENIYCDISPYNDKELARLAGLGFYGKNTLLINPHLGSYFFIGYIVTEGLSLPCDSPTGSECANCGKCLENCPGGAISHYGFSKEKCASEISQKKGELSAAEEKILFKSGYIWGCDICQKVCPHNKNITASPLPEFSADLLTDLSARELENLSEKEFKIKFCRRAFTWRGKKPLIRNIGLLSKKQGDD